MVRIPNKIKQKNENGDNPEWRTPEENRYTARKEDIILFLTIPEYNTQTKMTLYQISYHTRKSRTETVLSLIVAKYLYW